MNVLLGYEGETVKNESKVCTKCGIDKILDEYSQHSNGSYLRTECKSCTNHSVRIRYHLKRDYGLPPVGYCCPICLKTSEEVDGLGGKKCGSWVIDHCHISDKFRGWLCHKCNRTIGGFDDDIDRLQRAIDYLIEGKETNNAV